MVGLTVIETYSKKKSNLRYRLLA